MTYTLIAHTELGSDSASITFSSIPQTFTDLVLKISLRGTGIQPNGGQAFTLTFNGVTTGYSGRQLAGATTVASYTETFILQGASSYTANTFGSGEVYIPNYRLANFKSFSVDTVGENNDTYADKAIVAGLWSNTAAITSLALSTTYIGIIASGSSATLYGITAGSSGGVVVS
jgi:hypothetical protein